MLKNIVSAFLEWLGRKNKNQLAEPTSNESPVVQAPVPTPAPFVEDSRISVMKDEVNELLSFAQMREGLDSGAVSSETLTKQALERAKKLNPKLNCFIQFSEESALNEARAADTRLKNGERNPLLGIPIAIKDLILCDGIATTAASKMLETFVAPYDATVISNLKKAGTPIIGKTNMDEFAMGSSNETSFFGAVRNPWNLKCVPGGSSGGSAAAVAAQITPLSLGTDTGGSIRQPSSLCGITGIKPTYGRVSRYGVIAFASSLDQVGPMCQDATGAAAVLECISGFDEHDATSAQQPVPSFVNETRSFQNKNNLSGLRIGVPKEFFAEGLDAQVKQKIQATISEWKSQGASINEITLPHTKYSLPCYYILCTSEASSNLARYDGVHFGHRSKNFSGGKLEDFYSKNRAEGFGSEVQLRILLGTFALSSGYYDSYFKKAAQVRRLIQNDFTAAFKNVDVIVGPTSPTTAFAQGEKTNDPLSMYLSDVYTLSTNLAGLPALSMNVGLSSNGLPIGMQMIAPWWQESKLLGLAAYYQKQHPETLKGVSHGSL